MKTRLVFICYSFTLLFGQSANFRYDIYNDSELYKRALNISNVSSLWLSDQLSIAQDDRKRVIIQFGYSIYLKMINSLSWRLPDIHLGIKPTENLLLSGRFFGFHLDRDSPQIIGSGIYYNFGKDAFWTISFQKSAINGLNDFRLVSSSFHLERNVTKSVFDIFLGIGSNSYINRSYYFSSNLPDKIEGNIKYFSAKIQFPYKDIKFGITSKLNSELQLFNFFIIKGFL
tara:strand:+ start:125 stop:811 length:687 start_codon:yes stop_codon:yes gene_type:complete